MPEAAETPHYVPSANSAATAHRSNSPPTRGDVLQKVEVVGDIVERELRRPLVPDPNPNQEFYFHLGIAPNFRDATRDSINQTDAALQVAIAGTVHALMALPIEGLNWDKVSKTMLQNPVLETVDNGVHRYDKLLKPSRLRFFQWERASSMDVAKEVKAWFESLVRDADVLADTRIDIGVLSNIVAKTGVTIQTYRNLVHKTHSESKTLLDIGVLRFPDIGNPHFKLYYIKLEAWAQCRHFVGVQEDSNGISGEYHSYTLHPRKETISKMAPHVQEQAVREAEALFA